MDKIFDCDICQIFNYFYLKSGSQYENNKLFSYNLNCYPQCPTVEFDDICRDSSELPLVFGTVSDCYSHELLNCSWDNQKRSLSNGIISHWINIGTTGRALNQWTNYDPSTPKYFHLRPD
jgi:hypothetical protein